MNFRGSILIFANTRLSSTLQTSRDRVTSASFQFSLSRPRLKEPVHDAAAGRHEDAEPPPLVGAHVALGALEQNFVG
jgi:hypothetical protein